LAGTAPLASNSGLHPRSSALCLKRRIEVENGQFADTFLVIQSE